MARSALIVLTSALAAVIGSCFVTGQACAAETTPFDSSAINDTARYADPAFSGRVFQILREKTLNLLESDAQLRDLDQQWNRARMRAACGLFGNPDVLTGWVYEIAKDQVENYGIKNATAIFDTFYARCQNAEYKEEIRALVQSDSAALTDHIVRTYRTVGKFSLDAHIFEPDTGEDSGAHPAIALFHGGSWYQGKPDWMFPAAKAYSSRGAVAIAFEYRIFDRQGSTPVDCIADAQAAIRWMRLHAVELNIDRDMIAAVGFSAGGHLAACCALGILDTLLESDSSISCVPNAVVLQSAVYDPIRDPWFVRQVEKSQISARACSPLHVVHKGLPPILSIHGTSDRMCPYSTALAFRDSIQANGGDCELVTLEGADHFYFLTPTHRTTASVATRAFLQEHGYLHDTP